MVEEAEFRIKRALGKHSRADEGENCDRKRSSASDAKQASAFVQEEYSSPPRLADEGKNCDCDRKRSSASDAKQASAFVQEEYSSPPRLADEGEKDDRKRRNALNRTAASAFVQEEYSSLPRLPFCQPKDTERKMPFHHMTSEYYTMLACRLAEARCQG